ncbi:MAG: hypothetical protein L6R41_006419 [Letrouitia leprolyta]|nr:MAG: hypothetical protein L6R41_006419 [Letrouitia leprolyta]
MSDSHGDIEKAQHDTRYSNFSTAQKRWIIALVAFAGMFSPLSSFIYYPAISTLASDLAVTITLINLTITSYMIVSGVTPAIVGDLADMIGRRPVYLVTFCIYFGANVGLALQRSYPGLLVLRMLQSAGGSGRSSNLRDRRAELKTRQEQSPLPTVWCQTSPPQPNVVPMLASYSVGEVYAVLHRLWLSLDNSPNVAPSLGPILGGVLAERTGWPWIFWLLAIMSGICLLILFVFFPETARGIVGCGGYPATVPGLNICSASGRRKHFPQSTDRQTLPKRLRCPNPLRCLCLLCRKENVLIITINGICYATYCCVQASLALLFIEIYHFKEIQAGLIYLPFGCGCTIASLLSGQQIPRPTQLPFIDTY